MLYLLKRFAKFILKKELADHSNEIEKIELSKQKLEKKLRRLEVPENILLKYYRIDNIGGNGLPPSYLKSDDKNNYTQRISELESVYRNPAFKELMAWSLNFHANMSVSGKITNEFGDEIDIKTDHAKHMISGIRSIWDLIVAAHNKEMEMKNGVRDPFEVTDVLE